MAISDISIILVLTGSSVVLNVMGVPVKIKVETGWPSNSGLLDAVCEAVTIRGSVALRSLVEPLLIICIFVEVSEVTGDGNNRETSAREDKLTLDFAISGSVVVLLSADVISLGCEERYDKVTARSVVLDVTAENLVFSVVAGSFNFEASVVFMSAVARKGNEVTSLMAAKVVLNVKWETAGV